MPIEVDLPDGSVVEFPDGTDKSTMETALRQHARSKMTMEERYAAQGINPKQYDPTTGGSQLNIAGFNTGIDTPQWLDRGLSGAGRSVQSTGEGIGQLVGAVSQEEVDERARNDQPLMSTGAGIAGNVLGTVGQLVTPGAALKVLGAAPRLARVAPVLNAASRALLPKTVLGSAASGAALGALGPVTSDQSRLGNTAMGAAFGGGGAALGRAIGAVGRAGINAVRKTVAPTVSNIERMAAQLIKQEAANPQALLTAQPSSIPGVQRTLAEETLDSGIARLERLLRSKGQGWDVADRVNNSARVAALSKFAGDDAAIAAAKTQRADTAKPLLERALEVTGIDSRPLLNSLSEIAKRAEGRPAVQSGLSQIGNLLRRTAEGAKEGAEKVPEDRLAVLYNVRKTVDDMLSGKYGGESAAALAGSRELLKVKESLDEVLTAASPEFGQYLDAFRKGSIPIGRMQIGRELMEKGGAVPDAITGNTVLTPAQFSKASGDLDRVAAQATGFNKAEAARYLEPDDQATINAIQDDLQRRSFAATAGSGGNSQTAERLMGDSRLSNSMMSKAASKVPLLGPALEHLREMGQRRLENKLAEVVLNPSEARRLLALLPEEDRRVLEVALTRAGYYGGTVISPSKK